MSLSQIYKRNNGNKEHALALIDGMVEIIEERKTLIRGLYDKQMEERVHRLQELDIIKSLLLAQREVIEKGE